MIQVDASYKLLDTKFSPYVKKQRLVKNFYFMQDERCYTVLPMDLDLYIGFKIYDNRVIGYSKFAHEGLIWCP